MRTALLLPLLLAVAAADPPADKTKRQIFREQVLPHSGGKIPSDAFRADRLALNHLNKEGVAIPDGVILDARHKHRHHSRPSDNQRSVVKLVLADDGRYVAPEGRYHQGPMTVDSTYIIRPPIGAYRSELRRPRPQLPAYQLPLQLIKNPGSLVLHSHGKLFSDHFYPLYIPHHSVEARAGVSPFPQVAQQPFSCDARRDDQLYADVASKCQVFHVCQRDGRRDSFLCPKGTLFSDKLKQCDWWYNVQCG